MKRDYRSWRNVAVISLVPLGLIAALIAGGIYLYGLFNTPEPPDPKLAGKEEVSDYLASDAFAKRSHDDKEAYLRHLRESGNLRPRGRRGENRDGDEEPNEEEKVKRERIRRNVGPVFRKMHEDRAREYCALPEDKRQAYLDDMIDRMHERRQAMRARRETDDDQDHPPERRRGRGPTPEHMKERIETTDPVVRAQMTEFRQALRARMQARRAAEKK